MEPARLRFAESTLQTIVAYSVLLHSEASGSESTKKQSWLFSSPEQSLNFASPLSTPQVKHTQKINQKAIVENKIKLDS